MKELKNALAQRCIDKSKEPMYLAEIESIKNSLERGINLSDVEKGDLLYIDCVRIPMEDVPRWPGMRDGRIRDTSYDELIKIKVQDIAKIDDHYVIEYAGGILTTLDFSEEWSIKQQEALRSMEASIVKNAIDDMDRWFKPNIEKFVEYAKIDIDSVDKFARREFYNEMMERVIDCIQKRNITEPYHQLDFFHITQAAMDAVRDYRQNGLRSIREDMARKLVKLDKPLIYAESIQEMESQDKSVNIRWKKLPKNTPFEMTGKFAPMTVADYLKDDIRVDMLSFRNLKMEDVIRAKDGSVFYVTNIGIFTATNMAEEYRAALIESQKASELCFDTRNTLQRYLSLISNNGHFLAHFDGASALSRYEESPEKHAQAKQSIESGASDFAKDLIKNEMNIVLCQPKNSFSAIIGYEPHERDPNTVSPQHTYLLNVLPGESIGLDVNDAIDITDGQEVSMVDIKVDEIQTNGKDFIIISGNTVYTSYEEIAEAAKEIYQEMNQEIDNHSIGDR